MQVHVLIPKFFLKGSDFSTVAGFFNHPRSLLTISICPDQWVGPGWQCLNTRALTSPHSSLPVPASAHIHSPGASGMLSGLNVLLLACVTQTCLITHFLSFPPGNSGARDQVENTALGGLYFQVPSACEMHVFLCEKEGITGCEEGLRCLWPVLTTSSPKKITHCLLLSFLTGKYLWRSILWGGFWFGGILVLFSASDFKLGSSR